ncbi:DUF6007 family protein [Mammaliicoccus sciuri]|nr:DUF6007 family protein [Mammaliicoccus sciuri]MCD8882359.1 hypothetical protein [Mammaliicoccus sciuri]MCP1286331.1 DUF6007 family protein [Mammaliicoccus sciuri]MEB7049705.1 DUF6007 family protein [Mammaliicoccus sciuri]
MLNNLKEIFKDITILEIICFIPFMFLFSYLPNSNMICIIVNIVIVIFCCLGASHLFYLSKDYRRNKANK